MFWNNVKELLEIQNLTQKELAAKTGINLGTLKNQICREVIPDAIEAVSIAKALNTTVEYLVTGKNNTAKEIQNNLKQELIKTLSQALNTQPEELIATDKTERYGLKPPVR